MLTSTQLTVGLLVLAGLGVVSLWTSGARAGRKAERSVREVTRLSGTVVRTVVGTVAIGGVQWAVLAFTFNPIAVGVTLGIPALFAAVTVARLLAVTEVIRTVPRSGRGGRR